MLGTLVAHRYRVLAKLGQGGVGSAFRARDEALDRDICLKLFAGELSHEVGPAEAPADGRSDDGDRGVNAHVLRGEFEILRGLVHPHLARVHDFGVMREGERSRPFFTSDIAAGSALDSAAWGKRWTDVVRELAGPLSALQFLHERGLRHGDFKPDNILVDAAGHGTLIDLSCAARFDVSSDGVSGTRGFIAPEVLRGERGDERADLFAVGATLAALSRVVRGIPSAVEPLIQRLQQGDPSARPSSVGEVLDLLDLSPPRLGADFTESPTLHGRERLVSDFRGALAAVQVERVGPRVIVVRGESGSGKSRLLRELKWQAEMTVATIEGFMSQVDGVRSLLKRAAQDPDLPPGPLGAVRARDRIATRGETVCIVIDDADEVSHDRELLDAFLRSIEPDDPLLVVLSQKATPPEGSVEAAEVWELDRLDEGAVRSWLGDVGLEASEHAVMAASKGHPSAVARAVRSLREGVPAADLDRDLRDASSTSRSVHGLDRLDVRRAYALLAASVGPVDPLLLREATGTEIETLPGVALHDGGLTLADRLGARATLDALGAELTVWAHGILAADLESRAQPDIDGPSRASSLAARRMFHLLCAGEVARAREVFGSNRALRAVAPRAWIAPAELLASEPVDLETTIAIARTLQVAGEPRRALSILEAGREAPDVHDLHLLRAECLLEIADSEAAKVAAAKARSSNASPEVRHRATAIEARALGRLGAHAEALEATTRALADAPHPDLAADLHECAGIAAMFTQNYESASDHLRQARETTVTRDPRSQVRVLSYDAILAFRRGDLTQAREGYEAALRTAEQHAVADQIPRCSLNLATACHQRGELAAAFAAYDRGERLARALGQDDLLLVLAFNLAKLYADAGAVDRAHAKATQVRDRAASRGSGFFVAAAESVLADVDLCRGDLESARRGFLVAREHFLGEGTHREVAEEDLELGLVASLLGDADQAVRHLESARASSGFDDAADLGVRATMLEARLAGSDGDSVRARRCLGRAIASAERGHLPELHARALAQLADVAKAQGLPGEATALAERARSIWSKMIEGLPSSWADAFWRRPERAAWQEGPSVQTAAAPVETTARASKLERLLSAFRKLNSSLETADVLAMAMDESIELTGAERGFLVLDSGDGRGLDVPVARNVDRASLDTSHLRFSRGIAEQAIRTASAVLTVDAQSDDRFRTNVSVHAMRLRSVIAVPIRSPDGVLGALYLDNRYAPARFDHRDADLLLAFADQVALALRNARQVEALRRRQEQLDAERARVEELARGQAIEIDRLQEEVRVRQEALEHRFDYSAIVGRAPALRKVFTILDRVIDSPLAVLVGGESGTGKELVARAIHYGSPRKSGPFVGINCAALPATLLEGELFGHAKGAFTGADRDRSGLVVAANGGTLFLDELAEMSLDVQAKLLRVLQEKEVRPLGSSVARSVDFRLVCATNRDLRQEVARGRFREDLFYRVGVVEVHLPALRERLSDLPELAAHFIARAAEQVGRPVPRLTAGALRKLSQHDWPGNVRELENTLTKAVVLADSGEIRPADVEPSRAASAGGRPRSPEREAPANERAMLLAALEQTGWNAVRAARDLGMPRATFYRRLRALGLSRPERSPR